MSRDSFDYSHASTGIEPSSSQNFETNGRPDSEYFDWWWYTVIQSINGHADEFTRLDTDNDGIVDEADDADTVDGQHYSDIQDWVNNNSNPSTSQDADTVDGKHYADIQSWVNASADVPNADYADDADMVDGKHYSDIQDWVNNNADVPNADYADNAGDADTVDGQHYSDIQDWVNANIDGSGHSHPEYYINDGDHKFRFEVRTSDPDNLGADDHGRAWLIE